MLQIFFSDGDLKPTVSIIDYTVDLAGTLQSNDAYVGFSSATGYAAANHDLKSWEFHNTYTVLDTEPVPLGSTALLLGLSLLGLRRIKK